MPACEVMLKCWGKKVTIFRIFIPHIFVDFFLVVNFLQALEG